MRNEPSSSSLYKQDVSALHCEPVWPSGNELGWYAEGPRFDPLRLSFLFKNSGLWTLSCDFAHTVNETLEWLTQLPTLMLSF